MDVFIEARPTNVQMPRVAPPTLCELTSCVDARGRRRGGGGAAHLQRAGQVIKIAADPTKNTLWVYTSTSIFEIVVTDEDRNVWEHYLGEGQFEMALQYAKARARPGAVPARVDPHARALTVRLGRAMWHAAAAGLKNAAEKDRVYSAQADYYFGQGRYQLAAKYYALTQKSFEEITLKLIRKVPDAAGDPVALVGLS